MAKFRKKPVAVEAVQWLKRGDHPMVVGMSICSTGFGIETPDGFYTVAPGDWIITDPDDEHWVCKPDIFEAAYEAVSE